MARVKLEYIMVDGEVLTAKIETDQDHPDALTDCANRAVKTLDEALNNILAANRAHDAALKASGARPELGEGE